MPAADFTFSGESSEIFISSGVTSVDVQDMYSRWKDWISTSDNSKFFSAFRTFGGDPTIAGQFAPRYYFLTNGWRVVVNYGEVDFSVNLYTDELEPPVIVGDGAAASLRNSDAVNVSTDVSQAIDYGGEVVINQVSGVSGTKYPVGTAFSPSDNLSDALVIANNLGVNTIHLLGPLTVDTDMTDCIINGGNARDIVTFVGGVNVSGTTFNECRLQGHYHGYITARKCILENGLSGLSGSFDNCGFAGSMYMHDAINAQTIMSDCMSQVAGSASPSLFLNTNLDVSIRRYSGGLAIYDCSSGTNVTIEFSAGNCKLLTGNTEGEIHVRGIASLTDQTSGTTVVTSGLLIPYTVAQQQTLNVNTEITRNK